MGLANVTEVALCRLDDIPAERAIGRDVAVNGRRIPLIVLRSAGAILAYLNSCPHVGVRLEWRPDDFLDRAGERLQCSTHGALFEKTSGECVAGPCRGAFLVRIATRVDPDGTVWALDPERLPGSARPAGRD